MSRDTLPEHLEQEVIELYNEKRHMAEALKTQISKPLYPGCFRTRCVRQEPAGTWVITYQYWKKSYVTLEDGKKWVYWGFLKYNMIYRCGHEVRKILFNPNSARPLHLEDKVSCSPGAVNTSRIHSLLSSFSDCVQTMHRYEKNNSPMLTYQFWKKSFQTPDGKQWVFLAHGNYNMVYRCDNRVYKIRINPDEGTDHPERLVRIWNEINDVEKNPNLKADLYESGAVFPFIQGEVPSASDVKAALLDIYDRTRRIVLDAIAVGNEVGATRRFGNFIKTPNGDVICVDVGSVLRFEEQLSRSQTSFDFWSKMKKTFSDWFFNYEHKNEYREVITMIKAILFVEFMDIELNDIRHLDDRLLREMLADAYDDDFYGVQIYQGYLLSKAEVQKRSQVDLVQHSEDQFAFKNKKYHRLNELFKLGVLENEARLLARNRHFSFAHLDFLIFLVKERGMCAQDCYGKLCDYSVEAVDNLRRWYAYDLRLPLDKIIAVLSPMIEELTSAVVSCEIHKLKDQFHQSPPKTELELFQFFIDHSQDSSILLFVAKHTNNSLAHKIAAIRNPHMTLEHLRNLEKSEANEVVKRAIADVIDERNKKKTRKSELPSVGSLSLFNQTASPSSSPDAGVSAAMAASSAASSPSPVYTNRA